MYINQLRWTASLIFLLFFIALHLSLEGNSGRLTRLRLQQPQEQRYPFLTVGAGYSCIQTNIWLPVLGICVACAQTLAHAIAQEGNTDTVRESALKVDSGKKIPLPHRGIEPASAACRSDALPTELHPRTIKETLTCIHETFNTTCFTLLNKAQRVPR